MGEYNMHYQKSAYCPEWFNIDLYNETLPFLDREEWELSIFQRQQQYKHNLNQNINPTDEEKNFNQKRIIQISTEYLQQAKERAEANKINDYLSEDIICELNRLDIVYLCADYFLQSSHLREYFENNLSQLLSTLTDNSSDSLDIDIFQENIANDNENYKVIKKELATSASVFDDSAIFNINTNFSDNVIIEEFKKKLTQIRERQQSSEMHLSEIALSKMIEYKVLPYMDLYLWQQVTGTKLTSAQIADLLYPLETREFNFDAIGQITRVTHAKAMQLFTINLSNI